MSHPVPSLWEASVEEPAPEAPALEGAHRADVAIVGAGFTGLTAALRLAEGGASVIVVDAESPGFGASGRNGGQVIPGLKYDPDRIDAMFGEATTAFAGATADLAFGLIEKHAIACAPVRKGWIQASVKRAHLPVLEQRMAEWRARGADVAMLDEGEMARRTGGVGFVGGWIDRRGGSVHPLGYARGLARAALAAGARLHGASRVTALEREGTGWRLRIGGRAEILAEQAVIATNGYSDGLWPRLKATVVPAGSFQVATEPLDAALLASVLPDRQVVSDSRRVANYFRIGPGGRLMMGGRGGFTEPKGPEAFEGIVAALHRFFPATRGLGIAFRWAGRVAMTWDHLPHLHQPFDNLTMALGYNGRGVALASAMGTAIGAHLLDPRIPLPLRFSDIKPLPLHGLHPIYASMAIEYYRFRDRLER